MLHRPSLRWLTGTISRPGFWFIVLVLALITLPYYHEVLKHPNFIATVISELGLDRHAFERILYLAPIVWAGFLFGGKGAFVTSLVALLLMLPRAIFISPYETDALFETGAVFIMGNVLSLSFASLRKEREYRVQLEKAQQELLTSEQRYRQLFESANDAIWLHNLEGYIIAANRAAEKLTGYSLPELVGMDVKDFLSEDSLNLAHQIRQKLLADQPVQQPYEQRLLRKGGSQAFIQMATSVVFEGDAPVAFQHIARDVTEQRRLQENLRYYLRQATRAQEEERKRISRELHDDTIQALVVLSRRLDSIASSDKSLSAESRRRLEELWQSVDNTIQGIRRLSQDLRPAALDRLGLLPALEWLAAEAKRYSGIETEIKIAGEPRRFPEEEELLLFRIIQEALRNVWRHSRASQAGIAIEFDRAKTRITISDNGIGFDLPEKLGDLARDGKLGLAGIQERAQLLGATLSVHSEPGKGSSITLELPL